MSNKRGDHDRQDGRKSEDGGANEALRSREGDPRKRAGQDGRTNGDRDRDRAGDDPSRAPESGTP
ncbi:MAG: hypothetical protein M3Q42_12910 [Pseudomonadota bacterium]|nr:hypothetical protein [Pseudomonadota bacterium]